MSLSEGDNCGNSFGTSSKDNVLAVESNTDVNTVQSPDNKENTSNKKKHDEAIVAASSTEQAVNKKICKIIFDMIGVMEAWVNFIIMEHSG